MTKLIGIWLVMIVGLWGCVHQDHLHTAFLSTVCIKPHKNYVYHVCHDIHIMIDKKKYTVAKGFKTDLASIPRPIWSIMSPAHSSLMRPAIVHDWFYKQTCEFDRAQTDLIFYHMLKNDGISDARASLMYYAVRLFGAQFYKDNYCEHQ